MKRIVVALLALCRLRSDASACECARWSLEHEAREAAAVFVGTIVREVVDCDPRETRYCRKTYTYVVRVDLRFKGKTAKVVTFRTGNGGGDCTRGWLGFERTRQLFLVDERQPPYVITRCSGDAPLTPETIVTMVALFGRPRA